MYVFENNDFFFLLVHLDLSWSIGNTQLTELMFQEEKQCDYWNMIIEKHFSSLQFGRGWGGCLLGILQKDLQAQHLLFSTCFWFKTESITVDRSGRKYNLIRLLLNG